MALVTFYDATPTDEQQLGSNLAGSRANYKFVHQPLSGSNIDVDTEILSVFVTSTVTAELIGKMPRLKLIVCRSTGFNNIDLSTCASKGIAVTNVPTYGENTVAEYAFGLILALVRKLPQTIAEMHTGNIVAEHLVGDDLKDRVIGIIGTGHIGVCTAKIAKGFGMKVVAYDPFPNHDVAQEVGFSYLPFDQLLGLSDVISLHVPYNPQTHHLINGQALAKIKKGCLLINTARGEIVDTHALIEALQSGALGGAGLDVLEGEKLLNIHEEILLLRKKHVPDDLLRLSSELNILKQMDNVIVTPHVAYNTRQAISRINKTAAQNILDFLSGKPSNIVKPVANKPGTLLLVRHGESEWNALGKWTGIRDVHLTEKGFREAGQLGQAVADIHIDYAYASQQIRALETLEGILDASQQFDVPFERTDALNERDYGDYTGKNKWEMRDLIGVEAWNHLRRDWNYPVPHGETLKDVFDRAVPFLKQEILPRLKAGKTVLVVSHGNAIRALIKYIDNISDQDVAKLEMPFGDIIIYQLDNDGHQTQKKLRHIDTTPPPA